jgi:hypothetical protein
MQFYLPPEIVDMIADYHDYDKYCKPTHIIKLKAVLNDIHDMASIAGYGNLSPNIALQCWGAGNILLQHDFFWNPSDEDDYDNYWNEISEINSNIYDDYYFTEPSDESDDDHSI